MTWPLLPTPREDQRVGAPAGPGFDDEPAGTHGLAEKVLLAGGIFAVEIERAADIFVVPVVQDQTVPAARHAVEAAGAKVIVR